MSICGVSLQRVIVSARIHPTLLRSTDHGSGKGRTMAHQTQGQVLTASCLSLTLLRLEVSLTCT